MRAAAFSTSAPAVEIDLILKGIKTLLLSDKSNL